MHILYKPGPDLYIAVWLSKNNHAESKDQKIPGINFNMDAIITAVDIPICTSMEEILVATSQNTDLQRLR